MKNYKITSRRTPIDPAYESCESTYVELLIYLDQEGASYVTKVLGIEPSKSRTVGEKITNSRGIQRTVKNTFWSLSSEGKVLSKDVRHHLDWLLNQLGNKQFQLSQVQNSDAISMTVNCIWRSRGSGGPTLWPEQMEKLSNLNLECSFDIYIWD